MSLFVRTIQMPNIEEVLRANGAEFQGYIAACGRTLVLFSDPVSGTTLALETAEFSTDAVAARLEESRREHSS